MLHSTSSRKVHTCCRYVNKPGKYTHCLFLHTRIRYRCYFSKCAGFTYVTFACGTICTWLYMMLFRKHDICFCIYMERWVTFIMKLSYIARRYYVKYTPEIPENIVKFPKKTRRGKFREFPGISGNFFRGFPGIPEIPGNFSGNLGSFSQNTRCGTVYTSVKRDENPGKSGKFSPKTCRTKFPGISGNFFRGFPGISEILGNFSGNSGFFPERALRSRVHTGKMG
jgi:hypothetical protein